MPDGTARADDWHPHPDWKDSYAVGGTCRCDSNGFDHGLGAKTALTPVGRLDVRTICADIEAAVGAGPAEGRVPYNDIQCGHGPANDAPDEAECPGRVDVGPAGCDLIGPRWPLERVYGPWPDEGVSASSAGPWTSVGEGGARVTASLNPREAALAIDGDAGSRWTTLAYQAPGQSFTLDLGEVRAVGRVTLDARASPEDAPAGYRLSISVDGDAWDVVARGAGAAGSTDVVFDARDARFVRVEQTGSKADRWWSIHELVVGDGTD